MGGRVNPSESELRRDRWRALYRAFVSSVLCAAAVAAGALSVVPGGCSQPTDTPPRGGLAGNATTAGEGGALTGSPGPLAAGGPAPVAAGPTAMPTAPAPRALPHPPAAEPAIRVRVGTAPAGESIEVSHPQRYLWVAQPGKGGSATMMGPLVVTRNEREWRVVTKGEAATSGRVFEASIPLEIHPLADAAPVVEWSKTQWPGRMVLHPTQEGTDIVSLVPIESYIPGVIAKELLPEWHVDAYRAQAIAARSYALVEMDRWATRRHYDVVAGERNQAWIGVTSRPQAIQGAADTRGHVLTFGGRVVPAYYSSCCGGRGANVGDSVSSNPHHDIWPLQSGEHGPRSGDVCCENAKVRAWEASLQEPVVRERLRAWGKRAGNKAAAGLGTIETIQRKESNAAGRAVSYEVIDTKGRSATVPAEDLRLALNDGARARAIRSGDFTVVRGRGDAFEFIGTGFGHGCGMCQYGAQGMAKSGASYKAILSRYYPGADLTVAW